MLDNSNGEIVEATANEVSKSSIKDYLPIGGGFLAGVLGGVVLDHFVIKPLIKKYRDSKDTKAAKKAKPVNEEAKSDEA
jgi:hypothetical protein